MTERLNCCFKRHPDLPGAIGGRCLRAMGHEMPHATPDPAYNVDSSRVLEWTDASTS